MSLVIVRNLRSDPPQVSPPGSTVLRQTLVSDLDVEDAVCEFRIGDGSDIWFRLPNGTPSKSITFQRVVRGEDTPLEFRVTLIRHKGTMLDGSVGINELITGEDASKLPDHCTVVIL